MNHLYYILKRYWIVFVTTTLVGIFVLWLIKKGEENPENKSCNEINIDR